MNRFTRTELEEWWDTDESGLDELGADDLSAAPSLDDVRKGLRVIGRGMKGDSVMYVQGLAGAIADGVFGPKTEDAVRAFQRARGLSDNGIVSASTMVALDKLAAGGTAGVEKIDFSRPDSSRTAAPSPGSALQAAAKKVPSWWTSPAWAGGWERWKVVSIAGTSVAALGSLALGLLPVGKAVRR